MKFAVGERVRVVSASSNFWGWTGEVVASYDGDLMTGEKHYQVKFGFFGIAIAPLLFREFDLAFAGE